MSVVTTVINSVSGPGHDNNKVPMFCVYVCRS